MEKNPYDISGIGCYVDSSRGIYAIDAIVKFAENHGWAPTEDADKEFAASGKSWSEYEFNDELESSIDEYMTEDFWVDGCYWGRNENGDWGLWQNEESEHDALVEALSDEMLVRESLPTDEMEQNWREANDYVNEGDEPCTEGE